MLKLTRLLHFHDQASTRYPDYYERALFNHLLGTQDPRSPHGFVCYYTGLSAGAVKQQPLNYFPRGDPDVYATHYDTFTCDTATGLETPAKFGDSIYERDASGIFVNQFIPSEVTCADQGMTLRQETGFPDDPSTRITVTAGNGPMVLRVRVPEWTAAAPTVVLNGTTLRDTVSGGWIVLGRHWRAGDELAVTFPMRLTFHRAPDDPSVQAASYGPVVLSGLGGAASGRLPLLEVASVRRVAARPMTFTGSAGGRRVTLVPVARTQREHFTVYWRTVTKKPVNGIISPNAPGSLQDPPAFSPRRPLPATATRDAAGPRPAASPARRRSRRCGAGGAGAHGPRAGAGGVPASRPSGAGVLA
jgi:hypothetical protein